MIYSFEHLSQKLKPLFFVSILVFSLKINAYEIAGITIPNTCQLSNHTTLKLQGAGVRKKLFFNVYVGAFYAESLIKTPIEALANKGPKRMLLHIIYKDITPEKFQNVWLEGIRANNDNDTIEENQSKIDRLIKYFDHNMQKGDIITLDYLPKKGTLVTMNGKAKEMIFGDDFYTLILRTWMGDHPPGEAFQKALLTMEL